LGSLATAKRVANAGKGAKKTVDRTFVKNQDELFDAAMQAAGGDLDDLYELKPGWWQGTRADGTLVKIEWEPHGHQTTNEGPHVTVREPKDPAVGPKGGWKVVQKTFIEGQEGWGGKG
jgi:hypothetical protein